MTILLTGATGFLGRHLLPLLLSAGHEVVSFGRRPVSLPELDERRVLSVIGDLASGTGLRQIPWEKVEVVIHLAASGVKAAHRVWADALAVNFFGTQRLLDAVAAHASGAPTVFIARTFYEHLVDQSPALLENPYIATKLASSRFAELWAKRYEGRVVLGTFFQVYGPGDHPENLLGYAAGRLKSGEPAHFGSGKGLRDWIYASDAAAAILASVQPRCVATTVDIGSGELVSIRAVLELLASVAKVGASSFEFDAGRDRPDVDLVLAASSVPPGWRTQVPLELGLAKMYQEL